MALGKQQCTFSLERCVANAQPHQLHDKCARNPNGEEMIYADGSPRSHFVTQQGHLDWCNWKERLICCFFFFYTFG